MGALGGFGLGLGWFGLVWAGPVLVGFLGVRNSAVPEVAHVLQVMRLTSLSHWPVTRVSRICRLADAVVASLLCDRCTWGTLDGSMNRNISAIDWLRCTFLAIHWRFMALRWRYHRR